MLPLGRHAPLVLHVQGAGTHGLQQRLMIPCSLVSVSPCNSRNRFITWAAVTEGATDHGGIARRGMGAGERPATPGRIPRQARRIEDCDQGLARDIASLPWRKMPPPFFRPAQEPIAGRWYEPLPRDHALAVVRAHTRTGRGLQHTRTCFFALRKQRIIVPSPQEQNSTTRPHPTDTNHLHRHSCDGGMIHASVQSLRERVAIALQGGCDHRLLGCRFQIGLMKNQPGVRLNTALAVRAVGQVRARILRHRP